MCTAMAKLKEKESLSCSAKVPGSPIKVLLGISIGTAMHNSDRSPFFVTGHSADCPFSQGCRLMGESLVVQPCQGTASGNNS